MSVGAYWREGANVCVRVTTGAGGCLQVPTGV